MTQSPEPWQQARLPHLLSFPPEAFGGNPDGCFIAFFDNGEDQDVSAMTGPLPGPGPVSEEQAAATARSALVAAARAAPDARDVIFAGYGPADRVDPVARALRRAAPVSLVPVADIARAEDSRYWSFLRGSPPEGQPSGSWRAWRSLAPAGDADELERQVLTARQRLGRIINDGATIDDGAHAMARTCTRDVREAITRCRAHQDPDGPAGLARVLAALIVPWAFEDALARMEPGRCREHARLWTAATAAAPPGYAAGPAALTAFTALQAGDRDLVRASAARAAADTGPGHYQPGRRLALLIESHGYPSLHGLAPVRSSEDIARAYQSGLSYAGDEPGSPDEPGR